MQQVTVLNTVDIVIQWKIPMYLNRKITVKYGIKDEK